MMMILHTHVILTFLLMVRFLARHRMAYSSFSLLSSRYLHARGRLTSTTDIHMYMCRGNGKERQRKEKKSEETIDCR